MAKGYWMARLDIKDEAAYAEYRKLNGIAFAKYGGKFLVRGGPAEIVIASDNAIDTTLIQTGAFTVVRSGGNGAFDDGNDVPIDSLQLSVRSAEPTVLVATKPDGWVPDSYRVTIAGNGSIAASDRDGRPIDGDADGKAGGDFVLYFDVGRSL